MRISRYRLRVFEVLNGEKDAWYSAAKVASITGIDVRTVQNNLHFLEKNKIITCLNSIPRVYKWNNNKKGEKTEQLIAEFYAIKDALHTPEGLSDA
jgi:Fe2+ or Zn2+ uptake regulation protein